MFEDKVADLNRQTTTHPPSYEKRTYTVSEIQDILGIGRNAAYAIVKKGYFSTVRIGGIIRRMQTVRQYILEYCDGKVDELVPIWLENGVNTMFPIEVGTWNASIAPWREKYGKAIRGVGGMDKTALRKDKAAVDKEIERMKRLAEMGGFIPCPDHRLMPGTKFELVQYYAEEIKKIRI